MNGGKKTSRLRSEFDLWIQAVGGTFRQLQQRREMGRVNSAAVERKRRAEERVAEYRAASRRKAAFLLMGLLLVVTLPTWAVVSALTAPSAHNGDTSGLGVQPPGYVEIQPAAEGGSIEITDTPSPSPEVAGVDLPEPTVEPTVEPAPEPRPEPSVAPQPNRPDPAPNAPRATPKATPKPTPKATPKPGCPRTDPACAHGGDGPGPIPTPTPAPATPTPAPPTPAPATPAPTVTPEPTTTPEPSPTATSEGAPAQGE